MTDAKTPQQDWLQLAFDTLALQTFTFAPFATDSELRTELASTLVTYGYSIGGRRGHNHFRVHLKDIEGGIAQHTVFVHPHAYKDAPAALGTLSHAVCDLGSLIWEKANPIEFKKCGPRYTTYRNLLIHPSIIAAIKRLPLLLPPFPAATFAPPVETQRSRLRLYLCHCVGPIGKARVASDSWVQMCTICHHPYLLQSPKERPQ
jgi:hypothetical protein